MGFHSEGGPGWLPSLWEHGSLISQTAGYTVDIGLISHLKKKLGLALASSKLIFFFLKISVFIIRKFVSLGFCLHFWQKLHGAR